MPGETLLIFSDGVTEAMNTSGQEMGVRGLRDALQGAPPTSAQEATETAVRAVRTFASPMTQTDDITCLALHRKEDPR
jgi:sigma-B regulation protein RsbU (phosphoserine phosphatase)